MTVRYFVNATETYQSIGTASFAVGDGTAPTTPEFTTVPEGCVPSGASCVVRNHDPVMFGWVSCVSSHFLRDVRSEG